MLVSVGFFLKFLSVAAIFYEPTAMSYSSYVSSLGEKQWRAEIFLHRKTILRGRVLCNSFFSMDHLKSDSTPPFQRKSVAQH